jgi:uncharacterized glyoxalase superfamily protein PhnB
MKNLKTTNPIREGFRAVTPYLFAHNASRLIEFIAEAFGGSEGLSQRALGRRDHPHGRNLNWRFHAQSLD